MARIRYEQSSALLAEEQKELSEQEEQQLETMQQKRLADLVLRQCTTILKSVLAHKVGHPSGPQQICTLSSMFWSLTKTQMICHLMHRSTVLSHHMSKALQETRLCITLVLLAIL